MASVVDVAGAIMMFQLKLQCRDTRQPFVEVLASPSARALRDLDEAAPPPNSPTGAPEPMARAVDHCCRFRGACKRHVLHWHCKLLNWLFAGGGNQCLHLLPLLHTSPFFINLLEATTSVLLATR